MLAQRLTHRVAIQSPQRAQDPDTGEIINGWGAAKLDDGTILDSVPAEVLTGPGREMVASDAIQNEGSARINVRWFPFDHQKLYQCRILWDGRIYDIKSVETDRTARQEWRFKCEDGLTQ